MTKFKRLILTGSAVLVCSVFVSLTSVACYKNSYSKNKIIGTSDLNLNHSINSNDLVFKTNEHNNIDVSKLATTVNLNVISYISIEIHNLLNLKYKTNDSISNFLNWIQSQKILVINARIPNPKWPGIPTEKPSSNIETTIENNFVIETPQITPFLYASNSNKISPGLGMQFAIPKNPNNLLKWNKGEIIANKSGTDTSLPLFDAFKDSANLILYLYPDTSKWIQSDSTELSKALNPLLTKDSQNQIIALPIKSGFDAENSDIGMLFLMSRLLNTKNMNWNSSNDGIWTSNPNNQSSNNLNPFNNTISSIWLNNNKANINSTNLLNYEKELNNIFPYLSLTINPFNIDWKLDGYIEDKTKSTNPIFPFAENLLKPISKKNNKSLSTYFNAVDFLLSLGFIPTYTTYILDPFQDNNSKGIALPTYIKNEYPNLIGNEPNQIQAIKQSTTGIYQHHIEPNINWFISEKINTIFSDDWLMGNGAINELYNHGNGVIKHIIYNSQGDYTTNSEVFFTRNNKLANYESTTLLNSNIEGFIPNNLINLKGYYSQIINEPTTGISSQKGNSIMSVYRNLQWFANQINIIKNKNFQIPNTNFKFLTDSNISISDYDWNIQHKKNSQK